MSYNTRRTGSGAGRGQTTQVNYHQQPSRPVSSATQQARNPGYTTGQSTNYNSASQPVYSTQQPGYTTAPPPPPQSQSPTQPPLPSQQPQQPTTPASSLKQEPVTPIETPKMDTSTTENGDGTQTKPIWKRKPFVKLSSKVKRLRQNAKLRRVLNPKNALTFLNELRPGAVKFLVREEIGWGFVASVEIDGKTFNGNGMTVSKAKVKASEQALKHILLDQLAKSQASAPDKEESKKETEETEMEVEEKEGEGEVEGGKKPKRRNEAEDEMPWGSLAAFALHKLFEEWQKEGEMIPPNPPQEKYDEDVGEALYYRRPGPGPVDFGYPRRFPGMYNRGRGFGPPGPGPFGPRGGFSGPRRPPPPVPASTYLNDSPRPTFPLGLTSPQNPNSLKPMKKIPDDANQRHPVMLLNQLKPNVIYNETREGDLFKITVDMNGEEFIGKGRSKKDAKKIAAKGALAQLGILYPNEDN